MVMTMKINHTNWKSVTVRYPIVWLAAGITLFATAVPVSAIDTFTLYHISGPCDDAPFENRHFLWSERQRIKIASGEKIAITLYGFGADFAQDATGSNIHEWIEPWAAGGFAWWGPGWKTIIVKATPSDGVGNRTITVIYPIGTERFNVKIVDCNGALRGAPYRIGHVGQPPP